MSEPITPLMLNGWIAMVAAEFARELVDTRVTTPLAAATILARVTGEMTGRNMAVSPYAARFSAHAKPLRSRRR